MTDPCRPFNTNPFADTITNPFHPRFDEQERENARALQESPFVDPAFRSAPGTPERAISPSVIPDFNLRTPKGKNTVDLRRTVETDRGREPARLPVVVADQASDTSSRRSSVAELRRELAELRAEMARLPQQLAATVQPNMRRATELADYAERYERVSFQGASQRASEVSDAPSEAGRYRDSPRPYSDDEDIEQGFAPPLLTTQSSTTRRRFEPFDSGRALNEFRERCQRFCETGGQVADDWRRSSEGVYSDEEDRLPSYHESQAHYARHSPVDDDEESYDSEQEYQDQLAQQKEAVKQQFAHKLEATLSKIDIAHPFPAEGSVPDLFTRALGLFKAEIVRLRQESFAGFYERGIVESAQHADDWSARTAKDNIKSNLRNALLDGNPNKEFDDAYNEASTAADDALQAFKQAVEQVEQEQAAAQRGQQRSPSPTGTQHSAENLNDSVEFL